MKCIGYGSLEDRCEEEATTPAGIWCPGCEEDRRATVTRAFDRISASFAADLAKATAP